MERIGSKYWMAENLKTTKYLNGDSIGTTTPDTLDISGEASDGGESPRDTVKITVKAEYLADHNEDDALELEQEIEMDYSDDLEPPSSLSDDDINELI
jgi:hypothetical protein